MTYTKEAQDTTKEEVDHVTLLTRDYSRGSRSHDTAEEGSVSHETTSEEVDHVTLFTREVT